MALGINSQKAKFTPRQLAREEKTSLRAGHQPWRWGQGPTLHPPTTHPSGEHGAAAAPAVLGAWQGRAELGHVEPSAASVRMGEERIDQRWRQGEEILPLAKFTPSWLGSRDGNQPPAPTASSQLGSCLLLSHCMENQCWLRTGRSLGCHEAQTLLLQQQQRSTTTPRLLLT